MCGWLATPPGGEALSLTEEQLRIDLGRSLGSDFTLQYQEIVRLTIEAVSPGHCATSMHIEQADDDANMVARALQRAIEEEIRVDPSPRVDGRPRLGAVEGRKRAIDAGDPAESRQGRG